MNLINSLLPETLLLLLLGVFILPWGSKRDRLKLALIKWSAVLGVAAIVAQTVNTARQHIFNKNVTTNVFFTEFFPTLPDAVTPMHAPQLAVVGGGFREANVSINGASAGLRALLVAQDLLFGLVLALAAYLLFRVCVSLLQGGVFQPRLAKSLRGWGSVITLFGLALAVVDQVRLVSLNDGLYTGYRFADEPWVIQNVSSSVGGLIIPAVSEHFLLWPILIGIVTIAVAFVLDYGRKLQADTEGLV